ncbi:hypothetical protein [Flexivirga caeni]|nr:hypothetical protein [Flexivirga caeni]
MTPDTSNADSGIVSEEAIVAKWAEMSPLIDRLAQRVGMPDEFPVLTGSALAGDEAACAAYPVSHAASLCLTAAVDHLHAAKVLVADAGFHHLAASSTLARGVIENAATGYWMLASRGRDERVTRALRWYLRNAHDQEEAARNVANVGGATEAEVKKKIKEASDRRGLDWAKVTSRLYATSIIREVEGETRLPLTFLWRVCSGLAHGRPWAYLGALTRETQVSHTPGVQEIRLTSSSAMALYPTLEAMHLVMEFIRLRDLRAGIFHPPRG